jgi:hypothetical protein
MPRRYAIRWSRVPEVVALAVSALSLVAAIVGLV